MIFIFLQILVLNYSHQEPYPIYWSTQDSVPFSTPTGWEPIDVHCINLYKYQSGENAVVIRSQKDFENVFEGVKNLNPNCTIDILPNINFNEFSLIGYALTSGGCDDPYVDLVVKQTKDITLMVRIQQNGSCKKNIIKNYWWRVPKIDSSISVQLLKSHE